MRFMPALVIVCSLGVSLAAQQPYAPARYVTGARPGLPALVVGGGQALLELVISPSGSVTTATPLRSTPPFTQAVTAAALGWLFSPAEEDTLDPDGKPTGRGSVPAKVLVAALYRAPTLLTPTLGERPKDVASASPEVAFPTATSEPVFPPQARGSGVVLIEALVDQGGKIVEAQVIGSALPFDEPALEAARRWRFRPARVRGRATATYVYMLFGFPEPVTGNGR